MEIRLSDAEPKAFMIYGAPYQGAEHAESLRIPLGSTEFMRQGSGFRGERGLGTADNAVRTHSAML